MDILLSVLAVVLFASLHSCNGLLSDGQVSIEWKKFQKNFGKSYRSPLEAKDRLKTFRQNLEIIQAHNALYDLGKETWTMGVTPFADWTSDEFTKYVNKFPYEPLKDIDTLEVNLTSAVPAEVDWRKKNAVSEVKNQKDCGGCWSFAATGAMEGQFALKKNIHVSLSEQNLIDCATYYCHGCNGGSILGAFVYANSSGITTEANYPFKANTGSCKNKGGSYFVDKVFVASPQNDEGALQAFVAQYGPVAVAMEAYKDLAFYESGVYSGSKCTGNLNHGVLVVGYGNTRVSKYWLIKNSWGGSWGEQGYFKLQKDVGDRCRITSQPLVPRVTGGSHSLYLRLSGFEETLFVTIYSFCLIFWSTQN